MAGGGGGARAEDASGEQRLIDLMMGLRDVGDRSLGDGDLYLVFVWGKMGVLVLFLYQTT